VYNKLYKEKELTMNSLKIKFCTIDRVFNIYLNSCNGKPIATARNKNVAIAEAKEKLGY